MLRGAWEVMSSTALHSSMGLLCIPPYVAFRLLHKELQRRSLKLLGNFLVSMPLRWKQTWINGLLWGGSSGQLVAILKKHFTHAQFSRMSTEDIIKIICGRMKTVYDAGAVGVSTIGTALRGYEHLGSTDRTTPEVQRSHSASSLHSSGSEGAQLIRSTSSESGFARGNPNGVQRLGNVAGATVTSSSYWRKARGGIKAVQRFARPRVGALLASASPGQGHPKPPAGNYGRVGAAQSSQNRG